MSIYQIVLKGQTNDDIQLRNVHHYEFASYVPTSAQLQEAVDELDSAYKDALQAHFTDNCDFNAYDVRRVDVGDLPTIELIATAGAWSGSSTVDPNPSQLAAMCTWKAPTVYPRSTRSYLFPFTTDLVNTIGRIDATVVGDIEDFASDAASLVITAGADAVKVAVEYGGTPRAVTDSNQVETFVVTNVYRTQRRRTAGVGI